MVETNDIQRPLGPKTSSMPTRPYFQRDRSR